MFVKNSILNQVLKQACTVLPLPPSTMRVLLTHYKWNKEYLLDAFIESGDTEKLLHNVGIQSSNENQNDDITSTENECQICCSLKTPQVRNCFCKNNMKFSKLQLKMYLQELYGLTCGHIFCTDCWNTYVRTQMQEGMGYKITCIGYKCSTLLDDDTVMKLTTDLNVRDKYKESIVNSFVQVNKL